MQKLESALELVSSHPDYRILRRFTGQEYYEIPTPDEPLLNGLYVDTETTGVDYKKDKIIELALVPFRYTASGVFVGVLSSMALEMKHDPGFPLSMEIEEVTGLTSDDLAGHALDITAGEELFGSANLVVAHNAGFDRKFVEPQFPTARLRPWACSYMEVPWAEFGAPAARLEVLAHFLCNIFYDAHRAMIDCQVGCHVLATAAKQGKTAFRYLLESSQSESMRVWAVGAPFHTKDQLKLSGYKWNDGTDRRPKAWYKTVNSPESLEKENEFLRDVCGSWMRPHITTIEAVDRYSIRDL